jgi:hypothetical protein
MIEPQWIDYIGATQRDLVELYSPYGPLAVRANSTVYVSELHRNVFAEQLLQNAAYDSVAVYQFFSGNNFPAERVFNRIANSLNFMNIYGECHIDAQLCPVGSVVEAVTFKGYVAGRKVVEQAGYMPALRVYGKDQFTDGFDEGSFVEIRIDGVSVDFNPGYLQYYTSLASLIPINLTEFHPTITSIEGQGNNMIVHGTHLFPTAKGELPSSSQIWFEPLGHPVSKVIYMSQPSTWSTWTDDTLVFPMPTSWPAQQVKISVRRGNGKLGVSSTQYLFTMPGSKIFIPQISNQ